jgi:Mitochondrial ribosomal protein L37
VQDPPLLPDSDYPSWLWQLGDTRPPLSQLRRAKDDELSFEQVGLVTGGSAGLVQRQYGQLPSPTVADDTYLDMRSSSAC